MMRSAGLLLAVFLVGGTANACDAPVSICSSDAEHSLGLVRAGNPVSVFVDQSADPAVQHAATSFTADLERVSGKPATRLSDLTRAQGEVVVIGVLGHSEVIDGLIKRGKIQAQDIAGQWEAYKQIVVEQPFADLPKVQRALIIVGADRRGAVFGTYDLSSKMGVSPWYWWADVPVRRRQQLFLTAGQREDQPKVKYRGFFINDEAPSFSGWAAKKFGGVNAKLYAHVFELLLRLKGNYLWPAMWDPRAFAADDPEDMVLADQMGVVMGTSHQEPMMRAHAEWARANAGKPGKWDYTSNGPALRAFWRGGIERMMAKGVSDGKRQPYESVVTMGMRGDGDEPMTQGTAIGLLQGIVKDQRQIIAGVTGKPADQTPQLWALYKEVQDYYDQGMQVPDDVTLLFSDDNWGEVRRLPTHDLNRKGGYGVYYHFDYVGSPRNYKWINTNQIEKAWQQLDLTYRRGADALWVVNVGDIKPMEYPMSFFMDMAWNPTAMNLDALQAYPLRWAEATFGGPAAKDIARIVTTYSQDVARRKPELIDPQTFALGEARADALDGGEFGRLVAQWNQLEKDTLAVEKSVRPDQDAAYFELVAHPVMAMANLYRLYYDAAWNRKLAAAHDARANVFADLAEAAFQQDQRITDAYHHVAGGKWDGMMLQTHIGYTGWQEPKTNVMPVLKRVASSGVPAISEEALAAQLDKGASLQMQSQEIVIEAPNFSRAMNGKNLSWRSIAHLGATLGAVTAFPQGLAATTVDDRVRLEYDVTLPKAGDTQLRVKLVPTMNTRNADPMRLGVSMDEGPVQTLSFDFEPNPDAPKTQAERDWAQAVINNAWVLTAKFPGLSAGHHTLKLWRLDDNVVVQLLVLTPLN